MNHPVLQEFIGYLKELILDKYAYAYNLIKVEGLKHTTTLNAVLVWQSVHNELVRQKKGGLILEREYNEKYKLCLASMLHCLSNLQEDELEDGILDNFKLEKENSQKDVGAKEENTEGGGNEINYFDYSEDIEEQRFSKKRIVLDKIGITEIEIPANNDILNTPERRYEFKRRMTNIQNHLTLGTYGKALEECEHILKNLELQSGQLHEYHTISYFKTKGGEYGIIQDIQNLNDTTLKQLMLCIDRCRWFNKNNVTTLNTHETVLFEDKVEWMCYRMSVVLRQFYRGLPRHNYIRQGDNPDQRRFIFSYMATGFYIAKTIYKGQKPITIFLEDALTELNGGGKLDWLDVTADWQVKNSDRSNFLDLRNDIVDILKNTNAWEICKKRMYRHLAIKFNAISVSKISNEGQMDTRQAFRRFFKTAIIAYKCFDDTRFLELFKAELLHKGQLAWFELDDSGKVPRLIPHAECIEMGYNPLKDLIRLQQKFNVSEFLTATNAIIADLKREKEVAAVKKKVAEVDARYEELKQIGVTRDIYCRQKVVHCLEEWQTAYENVKFDTFINRVIKELIGKEGLFHWFELNPNADLQNHKDCPQLNFDAQNNLEDGLEKSMDYYQNKAVIWDGIKMNTAELLQREADLKYEQL